MKFTIAAVLAAATGAIAGATNLTYTTEVVDVYTTYCPAPTQITIGSKTWTVTEATTLTITDCSCTVTKPIYTTSSVICHTCPPATAPAAPTYTAPVYNTTIATAGPTYTAPGAPAPTGSTPTQGAPSSVPTAGAGKAAFLSGAGLAGLVGLAAFAL